MIALLLLSLSVFAQTQAEVEQWGSLPPTQILNEAVARRRIGDFEGAGQRLSYLGQRSILRVQVAYHTAVLAEVQEDFARAEAGYGVVVASWPEKPEADDARFRQVYCLEELGQHKAALQAVRQLQRAGRWSVRDAHAMNLERGIVELRAGKHRRGIRRILRELSATDVSESMSWIRAKARLALVRVQVREAATLELKGNRRAAKHLITRSRLISSSEKQAIAMFELGEPEFALEGLLLLGDAYMDLHKAMLEYPPPRSVPASEHASYRAAVHEKAAILKVKAHARYDEGVRVAARTRWQGRVTAELKARRAEAAP
jgi:tetratricopeptide (TPR) repeat protein